MASVRPPKIGYLGSCRIAGPLKLLAEQGRIELVTGRNYGYVHSPAECLQLARFIAGDAHPPADKAPFLAPNVDLSILETRPTEDVDILVVELSSSKTYWLDDWSVQANYLAAYFKDVLPNTLWPQFQTALSTCNFKDFLASHSELLGSHEISVLKRLQTTRADSAEVYDTLVALQNSAPSLVIVPHVNALDLNHRPLRSRDAFRRLVVDAALRLELQVFDPTELMHDVGQSKAIADNSTSLAHYTNDFTTFWSEKFSVQVLGQKPVRQSDLWSIAKLSEDMTEVGDPAAAFAIWKNRNTDHLTVTQAEALLLEPSLPPHVADHCLEFGDTLSLVQLSRLVKQADPCKVNQVTPGLLEKVILDLQPLSALEWIAKWPDHDWPKAILTKVWTAFADTDPPILLRLHHLRLLSNVIALPDSITRREQRDMKRRAKEAADAGDTAILDQLSSFNISGFDVPAEVHLYRARLAYFAEDWTRCVEHGLIALKALPQNKGGWIRLSRAAKAMGLAEIEAQANATLTELKQVPS